MTLIDNLSERAADLSRRNFLRTSAIAGGSLLLSVSLPFASRESEAAAAGDFAPNAFIRIGGDGKVVLTMPYVEMGQGTYTSIPMLIAEELEIGLKQVQLEHAPLTFSPPQPCGAGSGPHSPRCGAARSRSCSASGSARALSRH